MAAKKFSFSKVKQEEFLDHIRNGMRRGAAADAALGGGAPTRRKVRDYIRDHPPFEKSVLDAEVEATEHVEEALYQAAVSGSVSAAKTWLELIKGPAARPAADHAFGEHPSTPEADGDPFSELDNVTPLRRK